MKQFLLIPTSALVAAVVLTSCQKEELSCTQLTTELTTLLQNVTDFDSAEAAAPRAEALMKRLNAAMGRPADMGGTSLHASSADEGKALTEALDKLAEQMARVYASYPSLTHDGDIDTERLKRAVGAAGATKRAEAAAELKKGEAYIAKYMKKNVSFDKDINNAVNGFTPCFGSVKLKEALDFRQEPELAIWKFDSEADIIATPEDTEPAGGESADPAQEGDTPAEDGEAPAETTDTADDSDDSSSDEDSADETDDDTSSDDSGDDLDLDISGDLDVSTADEEPAADEDTTDDVSVDVTEDETSADEESSDEEPAAEEESTDEEPAAEEDTSSDDMGLDDFELDI